MVLKEFEKKQLDWWCNYYRTSSKDLARRVRQYMNGEIPISMVEVMVTAIENDEMKRDKLD